MSSGMVDEHASHGVGGDGEELCPVAPLGACLVHQPQVGLVDERGGGECVALRLEPELPVRHAGQVAVDQRNQALQGIGIAHPRGPERVRYRVLRGVRFHGDSGTAGPNRRAAFSMLALRECRNPSGFCAYCT